MHLLVSEQYIDSIMHGATLKVIHIRLFTRIVIWLKWKVFGMLGAILENDSLVRPRPKDGSTVNTAVSEAAEKLRAIHTQKKWDVKILLMYCNAWHCCSGRFICVNCVCVCVVGNVKRSIWIYTTISHSFTFYIFHSAFCVLLWQWCLFIPHTKLVELYTPFSSMRIHIKYVTTTETCFK